MKFKTGDRVVVRNHPDVDPTYHGLEGKIVAFLPESAIIDKYQRYVGIHRSPQPGDFFINFDNPPPGPFGLPDPNRIHQGGAWHAGLVDFAPRDPTIGEIADLFGIDPYDVANAALQEE